LKRRWDISHSRNGYIDAVGAAGTVP